MTVFNKCCFCVPLKTGCFTLGYLQLIGAVFGVIMSIGLMIMGIRFRGSPKQKEYNAAGYIIGISAMTTVLCLLGIAFTIVFLIGLHKSKPKLIRMYMIYCVVFLVMYFSLLVLRVITAWDYSAAAVLDTILKLVLSTYFLLVIRSYYLKLIDEQGEEGLKKQNDSKSQYISTST